jgi:triosephosphate isomerase
LRRPIVAGNWKMHRTIGEAVELAAALRERLSGIAAAEVVLCPPFTALAAVAQALAGSSLRLGAQNVHGEREGPYTGEISPPMLRDAGCDYVIVGHSERRRLFHETDDAVARRAGGALDGGLVPIVCVGETLDERRAGRTEEVLREQARRALAPLGERLRGAVVAYEPVWAIGTGQCASPDQAQAAHRTIRDAVAGHAGRGVADDLRILYGGSLAPLTAPELFARPDVDGGLVGGASLDASAFTAIVRAVS